MKGRYFKFFKINIIDSSIFISNLKRLRYPFLDSIWNTSRRNSNGFLIVIVLSVSVEKGEGRWIRCWRLIVHGNGKTWKRVRPLLAGHWPGRISNVEVHYAETVKGLRAGSANPPEGR